MPGKTGARSRSPAPQRLARSQKLRPREDGGWFAAHARQFRRFHANPFNAAAHLVTTPLCIAAALALAVRLGVPELAAAAFLAAWALSLGTVVPTAALWVSSAAVLGAGRPQSIFSLNK